MLSTRRDFMGSLGALALLPLRQIRPDLILYNGDIITIEFFEERPVGIELPKTVDIKVTYTEPGVKGATATNTPTRTKLAARSSNAKPSATMPQRMLMRRRSIQVAASKNKPPVQRL